MDVHERVLAELQSKALSEKAGSCEENGDFANARVYFNQAARIDRNNSYVQEAACTYEIMFGNYAEALKHWEYGFSNNLREQNCAQDTLLLIHYGLAGPRTSLSIIDALYRAKPSYSDSYYTIETFLLAYNLSVLERNIVDVPQWYKNRNNPAQIGNIVDVFRRHLMNCKKRKPMYAHEIADAICYQVDWQDEGISFPDLEFAVEEFSLDRREPAQLTWKVSKLIQKHVFSNDGKATTELQNLATAANARVSGSIIMLLMIYFDRQNDRQ